MTLTLDFQGQIFNTHILGIGRSFDLEWKRCELDTMLDAQWACCWVSWIQCWAHNGLALGPHCIWQIDRPSFQPAGPWMGQPVGPWMGYSFTDLGAEGCCRSINKGEQSHYSNHPRAHTVILGWLTMRKFTPTPHPWPHCKPQVLSRLLGH